MQSCLRSRMMVSLTLGTLALGGLSSVSLALTTDDKATTGTAGTTAADNSERNKVHDGEHAVTADQQKNSEADVELTRKIRRAITKDKSLSTYAHNVKIISMNGEVTLKGPVKNEKEKSQIETMAAEVAGKDKVKNEIEVSAQ